MTSPNCSPNYRPTGNPNPSPNLHQVSAPSILHMTFRILHSTFPHITNTQIYVTIIFIFVLKHQEHQGTLGIGYGCIAYFGNAVTDR